MNRDKEIKLCDFKFINRNIPQVIVATTNNGMEAIIRGEEDKINENCWMLTLSNKDWAYLEKKNINYLLTELWANEIDMFIGQGEESAIFGQKDLVSALKKLKAIINEYNDKRCKSFLNSISLLLEKAIEYDTFLTINVPDIT